MSKEPRLVGGWQPPRLGPTVLSSHATRHVTSCIINVSICFTIIALHRRHRSSPTSDLSAKSWKLPFIQDSISPLAQIPGHHLLGSTRILCRVAAWPKNEPIIVELVMEPCRSGLNGKNRGYFLWLHYKFERTRWLVRPRKVQQ